MRALRKHFEKRVNGDNTKFRDKIAYVGGPSFRRRPSPPTLPQHLPPCPALDSGPQPLQSVHTQTRLLLHHSTLLCARHTVIFDTAQVWADMQWWRQNRVGAVQEETRAAQMQFGQRRADPSIRINCCTLSKTRQNKGVMIQIES